jgi:hypothetical protein
LSDQAKRLAEAFRAVAKQLAALSDDELAELVAGSATVRIETKASRQRTPAEGRGRRAGGTAAMAEVDLGELARELNGAESRDEAERLLRAGKLTGPRLKELARILDITVQNKDTKDKLQAKIVEGTIGFRLRSRAIRGY